MRKLQCPAPLDTGTATESCAEEGRAAGGCLGVAWCWPVECFQFSALLRPRTRIGRGRGCGIVLDDGRVSAEHAEIIQERGTLSVRDLHSKNGTFVDGRLTEAANLRPGSVLRVGGSVGVVQRHLIGESLGEFHEIAPELWGSQRLATAIEPACRAAPSVLPIIVEGETGTGKELVARAIHGWSGRKGPFIAVNCAAIPEGLAEAELFGYRRGAFTGAATSHLGHILAAHQGTLLLDELVELPLPVQAKLLRVVEESQVPTLGRTYTTPVDVRLVTTVQRPLSQAVLEGRFRSDLYARLHGLVVRIPPLRERAEDIPRLFLHLFRQAARRQPPDLEARLVERLCLHPYPMNVRELRGLTQRTAVLHGQAPRLRLKHLAEELKPEGLPSDPDSHSQRRAQLQDLAPPADRRRARDECELRSLEAQLAQQGGNLSRAARSIGISRQRAYRLLSRQSAPKDQESEPEPDSDRE